MLIVLALNILYVHAPSIRVRPKAKEMPNASVATSVFDVVEFPRTTSFVLAFDSHQHKHRRTRAKPANPREIPRPAARQQAFFDAHTMRFARIASWLVWCNNFAAMTNLGKILDSRKSSVLFITRGYARYWHEGDILWWTNEGEWTTHHTTVHKRTLQWRLENGNSPSSMNPCTVVRAAHSRRNREEAIAILMVAQMFSASVSHRASTCL